MMHHRARLVVVAIAALATACDDATTLPILDDPASVRIVNAADIPNVEVRLLGESTFLVQDLDFRGQTATCVQVPSGEQAFVFTSGGIELTTAIGDLEGDQAYTVFLTAFGPTRRAVVVPDDMAAPSGFNLLRFVNGTSTIGDVYVTPPSTAPAPAFQAQGNLPTLWSGNVIPAYVARSVDHVQVRLFDPGTTTNPRADISLSNLPATRAASVVFVNAGVPAGPTAFIVTPCP
ncbi:MAG: hypothetical protein ACRENU_08725 [Gemmatimonadaceae bacterium]